MGIPTGVPLKTIPMNPEPKSVILAAQRTSHPEKGYHIVTSKRLSLLISLALHLIGVLLATVYIVQTKHIDDDAVQISFMKVQGAPKPKRRVPPRAVKKFEIPSSPQIQAPRLQRSIATAVEIPTGDARFTLPPSKLPTTALPTPSESELGGDGFGRNLLVGGHRAQIASVIPQIGPSRIPRESIIAKIESTMIPQEKLSPDVIEPPTVALSDVTQPPHFLHQVAPKYPDMARRAQKEGVVLVEATIGVDGLAHDIKVIEGIGFGCDEVAVDALKASRFAPAKQGEKPVAVRIQIPYRFKLED
jgi:TonB family protein